MTSANGNGNQFKLSQEDYEELQRRARAEGLTIEEYVAKLIRDRLREEEEE